MIDFAELPEKTSGIGIQIEHDFCFEVNQLGA
jgi:hypothetical protein